MKWWGGIDPGKMGAIVFISDAELPIVHTVPLIKAAKGRPLYDLGRLYRILDDMVDEVFVVLEQVGAMPAKLGGVSANYERGYAQGMYQAMLCALQVPFETVLPKTWQRVMHQGTPGTDLKQKSILAARRLFPGVSLVAPGTRKDHDGIADALLLAEYGRRTRRQAGGGPAGDEPAREAVRGGADGAVLGTGAGDD